MAMNGPIVLVDDDANDIEIIASALKDLAVPNEVRAFQQTSEAMNFLLTTQEQPFIILCDIRMSEMNGLAFRKGIIDNDYLRKKSIPFVFFTAAVSMDIVNEAFLMNVQGFIQKARSYGGVKEQLSAVMTYWRHCLHPNKAIERMQEPG